MISKTLPGNIYANFTYADGNIIMEGKATCRLENEAIELHFCDQDEKIRTFLPVDALLSEESFENNFMKLEIGRGIFLEVQFEATSQIDSLINYYIMYTEEMKIIQNCFTTAMFTIIPTFGLQLKNFYRLKCKNLFNDIDIVMLFELYIYYFCGIEKSKNGIPQSPINNLVDNEKEMKIIPFWEDFKMLTELCTNQEDTSEYKYITTWIALKYYILESHAEVWQQKYHKLLDDLDPTNIDDIKQIIVRYTDEYPNNCNDNDILELTYFFMYKKKFYFPKIESMFFSNKTLIEAEREENIKNKFLQELSNEDLPDENEDKLLTIEDIDEMSGEDFEKITEYFLNKRGYRTSLTPKTGDQGIDIIADDGHNKIGVQVKRYDSKVGNSAIQEVIAGMKYYSLDKGMVVTNNYFTQSAKDLARSANIILWDRTTLMMEL